MNNGGQILWNAIPICETFKISCLMGRPQMRDVLEKPFEKDRLFHLVHWLSITLFLRRTSQESINLERKSYLDCSSDTLCTRVEFGRALICAKPATLEKFWTQITKLVVIKRGEALNPRVPVAYLGIRVPKCTRWRSQRIHSETHCQVRGRMLGHCSTAECKGSDDAFDGTEEFESA